MAKISDRINVLEKEIENLLHNFWLETGLIPADIRYKYCDRRYKSPDAVDFFVKLNNFVK